MMPNADAIALGKQIKAVRKAMGMTQDQLALKSHVSVKYIANIENGKQNPSFDILSAILHVLPLSLDSIINPNLSESILLVHQKCGKHCWKQQDRLQSI